jgi:formate-dependent nitrite reductase cytochrome c552 subunit
VEYYCANKMTLTFPWKNGLRVEDLEQTWEETTFPDGSEFIDYVHGETGAMTEMLDAILEAKAAGAEEEALGEVLDLQRKAMWRLDFISSENSRGSHASQEAARILGESIDYSRQAQAAALRLRAPLAPATDALPVEGIQGVTLSLD